MKLLFDQNLSPRLLERLADVYPGAAHVSLLALDRATDEAVWACAGVNGYKIDWKQATWRRRPSSTEIVATYDKLVQKAHQGWTGGSSCERCR